MAEAVQALQPTALIGVSGMPQTFTREIVELMTAINPRPIIFALSNPTSRAECTAGQAYSWSGGRAIFASGSPFPAFELNGRRHVPGQGNNIYIFPGVGLGALASLVGEEDIKVGRVYPSLTRVREVSLHIAVAVAKVAYATGLAQRTPPDDPVEDIRSRMFEPVYRDYV